MTVLLFDTSGYNNNSETKIQLSAVYCCSWELVDSCLNTEFSRESADLPMYDSIIWNEL